MPIIDTTGIRPIERRQPTEGLDKVRRREEGGGGFRPQTNVNLKAAIQDISAMLGKISAETKSGLQLLPKEIAEEVRNVLYQALSLESTLGKGIGSTIESQRFSTEQLILLSRMLSQMGTLAERGYSMRLGEEIQVLMSQFKALLTTREGGEALAPVLISKAAFELVDAKTSDQLPPALCRILAQLPLDSTVAHQQQSQSSTDGAQILKQLLKIFMPSGDGGATRTESTPREQNQSGRRGQSNNQFSRTQPQGLPNNQFTRPQAQGQPTNLFSQTQLQGQPTNQSPQAQGQPTNQFTQAQGQPTNQFSQPQPQGQPINQFSQSQPQGQPINQFSQSQTQGQPANQFTQAQGQPANQFTQTQGQGQPTNQFTQPQSQGQPTNQFSQPQSQGQPTNQFSQPQPQGQPINQFSQSQPQGQPANQFSQTQVQGQPTNQFSQAQVQGQPASQFTQVQTQGQPTNQFPQTQGQGQPNSQFTQTQAQVQPTNQFSQAQTQGQPNNQFSQSQGQPTGQFSQTQVQGQPTNQFTQTQGQGQPTNQFSQSQTQGQPANQFSQTQAQGQPTNQFYQPQGQGQPTNQFYQAQGQGQPINQFSQSQTQGQPANQFSQTQAQGQPTNQSTQTQSQVQPTNQFSQAQGQGQPINQFTQSQSQGQPTNQSSQTQWQGQEATITRSSELPKDFLTRQKEMRQEMKTAKEAMIKGKMANTSEMVGKLREAGEMVLKEMELSPRESAILQNFTKGTQEKLTETEARHLQNLLRLCQQNIPLTVQQAAVQHKIPELPKLWAFMQMCSMASIATKINPRQYKRASREVMEFANILKRAMTAENAIQQDKRSFQMMLPLYMGEEKTNYPTYLSIYDERKKEEETGEEKKETWIRICVLTEYIGAAELVFRVYDERKLDMRFYFSRQDVAEEFRSIHLEGLRESINKGELEIGEVRVGGGYERMFSF